MRRVLLLTVIVVLVGILGSGDAQAQWTNTNPNINNTNTGNVGIGTTTPAGKLHVQALDPYIYLTSPTGTSSVFNFSAGNNTVPAAGLAVYSQYTLLGSDNTPNWLLGLFGSRSFTFRDVAAGTTRMIIDQNGNVGIGTTTPTVTLEVIGTAFVSGTLSGGNIIAKYQDVAEWVEATSDLEVGTVVVLNREKNNEVMASHEAYDTTVAGVVSEQPGLLLGEEADSKEMIATSGRVRVRVDATRNSIRVGDLLVTGTKSGLAMKSEPVMVAGVKMHRPGTIIGKALEPLEKGEGEILVLLSMQ